MAMNADTGGRQVRRMIEDLTPREIEVYAEFRDAVVKFGARIHAQRAMAAGLSKEATHAMADAHMEDLNALVDTLAGVALTEVLETLERWLGPVRPGVKMN